MPCGCGGSKNVYRPPSERAADKKPVERGSGLPAVWNGPKTTVAK